MSKLLKVIKKIAVLGPNKPFFGARLIQIPLYQNLRANFPAAQIRIYSPVPEAELFEAYELADEVIIYRKSALHNLFTLVKSLRNYQPDIIINCREYSGQLHVITALAGKAFKIGFTPSPVFLRPIYDKTIPYDVRQYRATSYVGLVELLDLKRRLGFSQIEALGKRSRLEMPQARYICLIPGGGEGEHKRWGIQNFLELCDLVIKQYPNMVCCFILGFMETDYVKDIENALSPASRFLLFKSELGDMVKAIRSAEVTVSNDCGPSHLAQMMEVNFISVWGWEKQDPVARIGEWFHKHNKAAYIIAERPKSIKSLSAERVFALVKHFLQ